jgi:hypothetical protein
MIIAMTALGMGETACNQRIRMIPVRDSFVPLVVASLQDRDTVCRVERMFGQSVFIQGIVRLTSCSI